MNPYSTTRTISSKGQFTLPLRYRQRYHIRPGTRLWVAPVADGFTIQPLRIAAVRFDAAYRRFSVQCATQDQAKVLGVQSNLTAQHISRLTHDPTIAEQARQHPDEWVETKESGNAR